MRDLFEVLAAGRISSINQANWRWGVFLGVFSET